MHVWRARVYLLFPAFIQSLNQPLAKSWHSFSPVLQARLMAFTWLYLGTNMGQRMTSLALCPRPHATAGRAVCSSLRTTRAPLVLGACCTSTLSPDLDGSRMYSLVRVVLRNPRPVLSYAFVVLEQRFHLLPEVNLTGRQKRSELWC